MLQDLTQNAQGPAGLPVVSPAADLDAATPTFTPTGPMLAYLWALCEAISDQRPISNTAICQAAGISRTTLWNWKTRQPAFVEWIGRAIRTHASSAVDWELMIARCYEEAKTGSVEHARLLWDMKKYELGVASGQQQPMNLEDRGPQIVINIPRPKGDLAGQHVVVGMKLEG